MPPVIWQWPDCQWCQECEQGIYVERLTQAQEKQYGLTNPVEPLYLCFVNCDSRETDGSCLQFKLHDPSQLSLLE